MLYTVRFTTKKLIKKLDAKGNVIAETPLDSAVCLTALPHATAMSYSGADNFEIERYQVDDRREARRPAHREIFQKTDRGMRVGREVKPVIVGVGVGKSRVAGAAESGNLAEAING